MRFSKWHGIGNDFLIISEAELGAARDAGSEWVSDSPEDQRPRLDADAVVAVCDRHFGVGADGILVLGHSTVEGADARMLIHNADGSMAEMCGNGIRVAARWLVERGDVKPHGDGSFAIETEGGIIRPQVLEDGRVRVDMGEIESDGSVDVDLATVNADLAGRSITGTVVRVGNPHFVVQRAPMGAELHQLGPLIERHPRFPDRTNVEFWELEEGSTDTIRMRVWERGVGETLACGTGACAVAFAAKAEANLGTSLRVRLPGGDLQIELPGDDHIWMTGPAHEAWSGELDLAELIGGRPVA